MAITADLNKWSVNPSDANGVAGKGFDGVVNNFSAKITDAASNLNSSLANADFTDPGTLVKMQVATATYQVGLSAVTAITKSLEETMKGITQKM